MSAAADLGWRGILRFALVQTAIGAIVVLVTSTLNRVMIVELAFPAVLPAALVAAHYLIQLVRLQQGYRLDAGGQPGARIVAGMAVLAAGGIAAARATAWMQTRPGAGIALAVVAYLAVGIGVSAAGTANLTLLSKRVAPARRPLVAALVWIMMIAGFSLSAGFVGHFLRPFSALRLTQVFSVACVLAFLLAWLAVGRERKLPGDAFTQRRAHTPLAGGFADALRQQWVNAEVRCFTVFIFVSMMAFSAQELLLEPFAGLVFGLPPAASARLASLQNGGVLTGMIALVVASLLRRGAAHPRFAIRWMIAGTAGSAAAIAMLAYLSAQPLLPLLSATAFVLGIANGVFAVAALGSMMELSGRGGRGQEGIRMGLWGSAQALAFAFGGLSAGVAVDLARQWFGTASAAYTGVFCLDAALFLLASLWAFRLGGTTPARRFLQVGAEATVDL